MRIVVTGATGLIGSALMPALAAAGHEVVPLRRGAGWDPERGVADGALLSGAEAAVHLAGENIAARWTAAQKQRIRDSRVNGTRALAAALPAAAVLITASAIGYYGDRGDEILTEDSPPGTGFLADVCRDWEDAARAHPGRTVNVRFGVVLSAKGGALARMLAPFRLGVGGPIGSGRHYMSWIALDDAVAAIIHCLATQTLHGAVNVVAPNPVTNREFAHALGGALRRPVLVPTPVFGLKLAFGREMVEEVLCASQRVLPNRLTGSGFPFRWPAIEPALAEIVHR